MKKIMLNMLRYTAIFLIIILSYLAFIRLSIYGLIFVGIGLGLVLLVLYVTYSRIRYQTFIVSIVLSSVIVGVIALLYIVANMPQAGIVTVEKAEYTIHDKFVELRLLVSSTADNVFVQSCIINNQYHVPVGIFLRKGTQVISVYVPYFLPVMNIRLSYSNFYSSNTITVRIRLPEEKFKIITNNQVSIYYRFINPYSVIELHVFKIKEDVKNKKILALDPACQLPIKGLKELNLSVIHLCYNNMSKRALIKYQPDIIIIYKYIDDEGIITEIINEVGSRKPIIWIGEVPFTKAWNGEREFIINKSDSLFFGRSNIVYYTRTTLRDIFHENIRSNTKTITNDPPLYGGTYLNKTSNRYYLSRYNPYYILFILDYIYNTYTFIKENGVGEKYVNLAESNSTIHLFYYLRTSRNETKGFRIVSSSSKSLNGIRLEKVERRPSRILLFVRKTLTKPVKIIINGTWFNYTLEKTLREPLNIIDLPYTYKSGLFSINNTTFYLRGEEPKVKVVVNLAFIETTSMNILISGTGTYIVAIDNTFKKNITCENTCNIPVSNPRIGLGVNRVVVYVENGDIREPIYQYSFESSLLFFSRMSLLAYFIVIVLVASIARSFYKIKGIKISELKDIELEIPIPLKIYEIVKNEVEKKIYQYFKKMEAPEDIVNIIRRIQAENPRIPEIYIYSTLMDTAMKKEIIGYHDKVYGEPRIYVMPEKKISKYHVSEREHYILSLQVEAMFRTFGIEYQPLLQKGIEVSEPDFIVGDTSKILFTVEVENIVKNYEETINSYINIIERYSERLPYYAGHIVYLRNIHDLFNIKKMLEDFIRIELQRATSLKTYMNKYVNGEILVMLIPLGEPIVAKLTQLLSQIIMDVRDLMAMNKKLGTGDALRHTLEKYYNDYRYRNMLQKYAIYNLTAISRRVRKR